GDPAARGGGPVGGRGRQNRGATPGSGPGSAAPRAPAPAPSPLWSPSHNRAPLSDHDPNSRTQRARRPPFWRQAALSLPAPPHASTSTSTMFTEHPERVSGTHRLLLA